ncbi:ABC transporter substrate-binding protein [Marinifilum sp.]|uniref:ABC transporter substrate-binding protein n=1 Tax=Marinifilum sp. TaxID=2033137 RepID=UPI003BAC2751
MADSIKITDGLGREVIIPFPPKRIIPAVPSTTEFLFDLGLEDKVISRTKFCRYPKDKIKRLPNIGGPKNLYVDKINLLHPDLILVNEEENNKAEVEALMESFPVYVSKVRNYEEALENILNTGKITGTEPKAFEITNQIRSNFAKIPKGEKSLKVLYLIWRKPFMAVGRNSFIHSMLEMCGFENVLEDPQERYPNLSEDDIKNLNPDLVLLSSEPYPFEEINKKEMEDLLPDAKVELVDGEMFSWYESHMLQAADYFINLIKKVKA